MDSWLHPMGIKPQPRNFGGVPVEGIVVRRNGQQVWYTIPTYDPHREFGPAILPAVTISTEGTLEPHTHTVVYPEQGSKILVVFAGGVLRSAWVVGW